MARGKRKSPVLSRRRRVGPRLLERGPALLILGAAASLALSALLTLDLLTPWPGGITGGVPEVGDPADRSYQSPADLTVVDHRATEERRRAALEQAPVVYDFDDRWGAELRERVAAAFAAARAALAPVAAEGEGGPTPLEAFAAELPLEQGIPERAARLLDRAEYSSETQADVMRMLRPALARIIVDDFSEFRRRTEKRKVVVRELASGKEPHVLEATAAVLSPDAARDLLASESRQVLGERPASERLALVELAQALVRPNLSFNARETDERRRAAEAGVKEVTISLRKGEIIVRYGDIINESHVRLIEGVREQFRASSRIESFAGVAVLIGIVVLATWLFGARALQRFSREPRDVVFVLVVLLAAALGTKLALFVASALAAHPDFGRLVEESPAPLYFLIPVAAPAMLVRLVQSAETAALFSILFAGIAGLQVGGELSFALYTLVGSLVAALGASRVTQRGTLLRAGVRVGGVNLAVVGALALLGGDLTTMSTGVAAASALISGALAGLMVTAFAPVVESLFGFTTDVKLLELANREQPLLRELELRAPGTYHHSMMVGHLAEKAAEAVGANALLAKVAGYYHDIGKMRRPHFFVENVTVHHGDNRHEKLAPAMSARIIRAHVADGLDLGRQNGLAPAIMRGIGEHHGTSIIRFFYEKAKELADREKDVAEHDYRYPGPKPQTREAGILMLADSVEAASRTLVDTSRPRIQQLVQRTINNYFRDGQLDECSLTLRDLHGIARSFIDTLSAIRHERIDYPEPTDAEGRKLEGAPDEGVVERLEPRQKDRPERPAEKREDDLRRLGLS